MNSDRAVRSDQNNQGALPYFKTGISQMDMQSIRCYISAAFLLLPHLTSLTCYGWCVCRCGATKLQKFRTYNWRPVINNALFGLEMKLSSESYSVYSQCNELFHGSSKKQGHNWSNGSLECNLTWVYAKFHVIKYIYHTTILKTPSVPFWKVFLLLSAIICKQAWDSVDKCLNVNVFLLNIS